MGVLCMCSVKLLTCVVRRVSWFLLFTVNESNKMLLLGRLFDICVSNAQFVRSFGEGVLNDAWDFTATNDDLVLVVDSYVDGSHV